MSVNQVKKLIVEGKYKEAAKLLKTLPEDSTKEVFTQWNQAQVNDKHIQTGKEFYEAGEYLKALDEFHAVKKSTHSMDHHLKMAAEQIDQVQKAMNLTIQTAASDEEVKEEMKIAGAITGRTTMEESNMEELRKDSPADVKPGKEKVDLAGTIVNVPITQIKGLYPWEAKHTWVSMLHEDGIKALAQSLEKNGMQDPVHLIEGDSTRNPNEVDGEVYVIAGRNRIHAGKYTTRYNEVVPSALVQGLETYEDIVIYAIDNNFARKVFDKTKIKENDKAALAIGAKARVLGYNPERGQGQPPKEEIVIGEDKAAEILGVNRETVRLSTKLWNAYAKDPKGVGNDLRELGLTKTWKKLGIISTEQTSSKTPTYEKTFTIDKWHGDTIIGFMNESAADYGKDGAKFTHYKWAINFVYKNELKSFGSPKWDGDSLVEQANLWANEIANTKPIPATHFKIKVVFEDNRK